MPPERQIVYDETMCPRAQEALDHMITFGVHEDYTEADILDIANAIEKVASLLPAEL